MFQFWNTESFSSFWITKRMKHVLVQMQMQQKLKKFSLALWSIEEKWTLLECYLLQPLSCPPWKRLIAFSKCLLFMADKERLVGPMWELFPHCCYGILGKMCSSILVSAMNSTARQGSVSLLLCFYFKIDFFKRSKSYFACVSSSCGKDDLWGPLFYPLFLAWLKKAALEVDYSDWSWIWWSTLKIGCLYPFPWKYFTVLLGMLYPIHL